MGPDLFLLEASCVRFLDEVWRRTGGWRSAFWVVRSGSRFSDLIFDSPRSRTGGAWVSLGLSRCGFACQISPVWCGGCWRVSICLGFLVLEMLASSHKSDLGGVFLPGRATVSKIMAVSRGVFWWHVKLEVSGLACGEIWFSGADFSVPLVSSTQRVEQLLFQSALCQGLVYSGWSSQGVRRLRPFSSQNNIMHRSSPDFNKCSVWLTRVCLASSIAFGKLL
ncbi:Uncharacterized protein Rs2_37253 [Raphanus sativus]|nr:Uncharacterized protein Rs2_37253 [Raphanus sativus]